MFSPGCVKYCVFKLDQAFKCLSCFSVVSSYVSSEDALVEVWISEELRFVELYGYYGFDMC